MVALKDLSPDKQWEVLRRRAIRAQLEDWITLGVVCTVALALHNSWLPSPRLSVPQTAVTSPGYEIFDEHFIDDSPAGSYDFTLIDPKTDSVSVPIPSPCDGKVSDTRTSDDGGYGLYIEVQCSDGYYWFWAHLASVSVNPGDVVRKGQALGVQGSSGNSTGEHIHLEIASSSGGSAIARTESMPMVEDYLQWLEGSS